jgi:hypothetical protein
MTDERKPQRRRLTKQEIAERYDALLAGVDAVARDIRATSMMHSADAAFREQWAKSAARPGARAPRQITERSQQRPPRAAGRRAAFHHGLLGRAVVT